jgi:hypothetical protein
MRVLRDEFFIRKDFAFYDCGITTVLPIQMFHVYDLLRRHVWVGRAPYHFVEESAAWDEGLLFSVQTQKDLSALTGFNRSSVTSSVQLLRKLEWIQTRQKKRGPLLYFLGHHSSYRPSVWWADAWLSALYEWMIENECRPRLKRKFSNMNPGTIEEDCSTYSGSCLYEELYLDSIPMELRLRMVSKFVQVALNQGTSAALQLSSKDYTGEVR